MKKYTLPVTGHTSTNLGKIVQNQKRGTGTIGKVLSLKSYLYTKTKSLKENDYIIFYTICCFFVCYF